MKYNIVPWLKNQPSWLQEATIYLQSNSNICNDQIIHLSSILKGTILINPDLSKLQISKILMNKIRLKSISNVSGIDKLNPQKALDFGEKNISVIYGRNGSGKSGYARILKKICGKTSDALKHNIYEDAPVTQTCLIKFSIDDIEHPVVWTSMDQKITALSNVDIFDGSIGEFYLQQEREVTYSPQEILVFTNLVYVCDKIAAHLKAEKEKLLSKLPTIPAKFDTTIVAKKYKELKHDIRKDFIDSLTSFSVEDRIKCDFLKERLNSPDPTAAAQKHKKIKAQIELIKISIKNRLEVMSFESITNLHNLYLDAKQKRFAVTEGASVLNKVTKLLGIGQETWKNLWDAARKYSETIAYEGKKYPNIEENAKCVLCHQELNNEAKRRMSDFENFIQGELEKNAKIAECEYENQLQKLPEIVVQDDLKTRFQASEINDTLGDTIWGFFEKVNRLTTRIQQKDYPNDNDVNFSLVSDILNQLTELSNAAEKKAIQFEEDAKVLDRPKIQNELLELEAQQWVSQQKSAVLAEIERLKLCKQYDKWISATGTRSITSEAGIASEQLITEAYITRFNKELQELGAKGITVELIKSRNIKGQGKYRIQLKNAKTMSNPADILSDGEKRIVSLAAFLADVTGQNTNVPFVFDDPISSLDQDFEERTIDRLIELGKTRQVIIFTHRLSFLSILSDKVDEDTLTTIYINTKPWGTGEPSDIPFFGKKTKEALNALKNQRMSELKKIHTAGSDDYDIFAKSICSDFRIIIERIVETDLLCDIVQRHRRGINTKNKINKLIKIQKNDCDIIEKMMTKYSCYEHSQSNESPVYLPTPQELENDIDEISKWREEFSKRFPA